LIEGNVHQFLVAVGAGRFVVVYAFGVTWVILKIQKYF